MPMCDSGVPERHTTAVSSSKIGARNVAPASATHATTPSAVVSISASTSSGDAAAARCRAPAPRRTPSSRRRLRDPSGCRSRAANLTRYHRRRAAPTRAYLLLHEVRLRGLLVIDDGPTRARRHRRRSKPGSSSRCRKASGSRATGRDAHDAVGARRDRQRDRGRGRHAAYERFLPLNQEFLRVCNDWQVRPGNVPERPRATPRYDWAVIDRLRHRSTSAPRPIVRSVARGVDALRRLPAPAARRAASGSTTASTSGSRRRASTRTTPSGCSCTRICCSRSAGRASTNLRSDPRVRR